MNLFQKLKKILLTELWPKKKKVQQDEFTALWQSIFTQHAEIFCGLFGGMYKLSQGELKRKKSVLTEWCARVNNCLDEAAVVSMETTIKPLIAQDLPNETKNAAEKLMNAAKAADITHETEQEITITENNLNDYTNLIGDDFSPDDKIKILAGAWYQGEKLLEKGVAKPTSMEGKKQ